MEEIEAEGASVAGSVESINSNDMRLPLPDDLDESEREVETDGDFSYDAENSGLASSENMQDAENSGLASSENTQVIEHFDLANLETTIREAVLRTVPSMPANLPWELPGMDLIFEAQDPEVSLPVPKLEPSLYDDTSASQKAFRKSVQTNTKHCAQSYLRSIDFNANEMSEDYITDVKWRKALEKWYIIMTVNPSAQPDGLELDGNALDSNLEKIRDLFGSRSQATVTKRADAMLAYEKWFDKNHYFERALPLRCRVIEEYFEHMKRDNASASAAETFLEAVRFSVHVAGMKHEGSLENLISARSISMSEIALMKKKETKQARPLTVAEVKKLECLFSNHEIDVTDRYAAGAFLFALYGRCRWSDLRHVYGFQLDIVQHQDIIKGYVAFRTRSHKTARLVAKKGVALPLVAPIWGLTTPPWALELVKVSTQAGIHLDETFNGPMLPAPNVDGTWSDRSTGSREATRWLNHLLDLDASDTKVSSHSLKATVLSWCAKWGADPTERLILGHHATGAKSLDTYSRDLLAQPLRTLDLVLQNVRTHAFVPDATRSGQLQEPTSADVAAMPMLVEPPELLEETAESEKLSTSSTSSSSSESSEEEQTSPTNLDFDPDFSLFQHRRSRIVHKKTEGSTADEFVCGTKNSDSYKLVTQSELTASRLCKRCDLCKPIRNVGAFAQALKKQRLQHAPDNSS